MFNGWSTELVQHAAAAKVALTAMIAAVKDVPRQRYVEAGIIAVIVSALNMVFTVPVLKEELAGMRREREIIIKNRDQQMTEVKASVQRIEGRAETIDRNVLSRLTAIETTLDDIKRNQTAGRR